jgi:transcriptional regulatory protein LevR
MLEMRLRLLRESNQIDDWIYERMLRFIAMVERDYGVPLTEKNGARIVTHLSKSVARINSGEDIEDVDSEEFEEVRASAQFHRAVQAVHDTEALFGLEFPAGESRFMIINFVLVLEESGGEGK